MLNQSTSTKRRLAWLTPLSSHNNGDGPWVVVEENMANTQWAGAQQSRKVTHSGLLQLISDVLDIPNEAGSDITHAQWQSPCGRFTANWHHSENDNTRLFVQRPDDYFSRIDLLIDGQCLVAFQEPVWPHLQGGQHGNSSKLSIPADCLSALDAGAVSGPVTGSVAGPAKCEHQRHTASEADGNLSTVSAA